jgi:Histidine kinase-like ATPase domain
LIEPGFDGGESRTRPPSLDDGAVRVAWERHIGPQTMRGILVIDGTEVTSQTAPGDLAPVSLVIPCKAEYVALCRLVAGALGASLALDEEVIADLKVVVTEACNCFLVEPGSCSVARAGPVEKEEAAALRLDFLTDPEVWEINVSNPDRSRHLVSLRSCDPLSESGLALTIIAALVDSVEQIEDEAGGSVLRLLRNVRSEPRSAD